MPKFRVEQYELYSCTYTIEANSAAEAIQKLENGDCEPDYEDVDYIEIPEEYGMPASELPTADQLALNLDPFNDIVVGIRSVTRIKE